MIVLMNRGVGYIPKSVGSMSQTTFSFPKSIRALVNRVTSFIALTKVGFSSSKGEAFNLR